MSEVLYATAITALACAIHWYRAKGFQIAHDSRYYTERASGNRVPHVYARRWLLPRLLGTDWRKWATVSLASYIACGPLIYLLTGSLACVWLFAWLPGWAVNVRFPILCDQVALATALGAVVAYQHELLWVAALLLLIAGQCKEPAPMFALALMWPWPTWLGFVAAGSTGLALIVGGFTGRKGNGTETFIHRPFAVARQVHDPLDWQEMLLPWGGLIAVVFAAAHGQAVELYAGAIAGVSLLLAYGQLLIANDAPRLYQWAAPAVLIAVAPYQGPWLIPALIVHPFLCGAARRV